MQLLPFSKVGILNGLVIFNIKINTIAILLKLLNKLTKKFKKIQKNLNIVNQFWLKLIFYNFSFLTFIFIFFNNTIYFKKQILF